MVVVVVVVAMGAGLGGAGWVEAGVDACSLGPQAARIAALSKAKKARRCRVLMAEAQAGRLGAGGVTGCTTLAGFELAISTLKGCLKRR